MQNKSYIFWFFDVLNELCAWKVMFSDIQIKNAIGIRIRSLVNINLCKCIYHKKWNIFKINDNFIFFNQVKRTITSRTNVERALRSFFKVCLGGKLLWFQWQQLFFIIYTFFIKLFIYLSVINEIKFLMTKIVIPMYNLYHIL